MIASSTSSAKLWQRPPIGQISSSLLGNSHMAHSIQVWVCTFQPFGKSCWSAWNRCRPEPYFYQLLTPSTKVSQLLAIPTHFFQLLHSNFLQLLGDLCDLKDLWGLVGTQWPITLQHCDLLLQVGWASAPNKPDAHPNLHRHQRATWSDRKQDEHGQNVYDTVYIYIYN